MMIRLFKQTVETGLPKPYTTIPCVSTVAYRRYEGSGASRYVGADGSMACYRLKQATMSDDEIRIIYEI
ncbi:MAG TPA: hypothetical protein ENO00_12770 [Deltaproteobacteria bacterium]|nr:hypothetical protein [Deltaproteobacteria bacterium]